jgi:hypothetical protein
MTDDRSIERAARSWLDDGPTEAPDRAINAALLQIQTTNQERDWHVPWRDRHMTSTLRLLAGAAAIAVIVVGGMLFFRPANSPNVGAQSPSPSSAASAVAASPTAVDIGPLVEPFTSSRYGYTVHFPAGWTIKPATTSWLAGAANNWGSGINDELSSSRIRFSGAAQILAPGQTADEWLVAYGSPVASLASGGDPAMWRRVTIDGFEGRIPFDGVGAAGSSLGGLAFDAVVVAGGVAYNFNMDGLVDRATFGAVLATVRLPSIPVLDTGFTSPLGGYSIERPSDWTVTPATKSWTSGYETQSFSDHIGVAPSIDGTSMKLAGGTTFDTWFAGYDADRVVGTACGAPSSNEDIVVDGSVGHLDVHCPTQYLEAVVPKGGRVYVFTMFTPFSRPLFESLLATVRLTPASAKN